MNIEDVPKLLREMTLDEKISLLAGKDNWSLDGVERLGIPAIRVMDGPHGVRSTPEGAGGTEGPSTSFPTGVCTAASWKPQLAEKMGGVLAQELRAKSFDVLLGPCINLHRIPTGGRNFESFGEDPFLTSAFTLKYIHGVQSQGVGTSLKHYACNNQEQDRRTISTEVDERTLREVYLYAFEEAVKKEYPWTVMGSYNRINGTYACEHPHLLRDILRDEWGYEGTVISDWGAVHSACDTLNAGCNLEMPGPGKFLNEDLKQYLDKGEVTEEVIDENVQRVLELIARCTENRTAGKDNTPEHQELAQHIAEEGIVLLKNKGPVLPLNEAAKPTRIAVVGPLADAHVVGGGGSALVTPPHVVSPLEGIRNKVGDSVEVVHEPGCQLRTAATALDASLFTTEENGVEKQGFTVEYFNGSDCSGTPVVRQVESEIVRHNHFGEDRPIEGVQAESFSIRWSGTLTAPTDGEYCFALITDDKGKVLINGEEVINNWDYPEVNIVKPGSIKLEAGKPYEFEVLYGKESGPGGIMLEWSLPTAPSSIENAKKVAAEADAVIAFVGLNENYESEGFDRESFALPGEQDTLIQTVAGANSNTVVALYNGSPVDMRGWVNDVAGILECWYPSQEGGNAVANILWGDVNPSGKLPVTFPKKFEDASGAADYPGHDGKVDFSEGVFLGYRHFDAQNIEPLFPFGYGLSYTTFEYSGLSLEYWENSPGANVVFTLANKGDRAGAEAVQVYVKDREASVSRPPQELKGFEKVFLEPGESKDVRVALDEKAFSYVDPETHQWTCESGEFEVLVGANSRDIRLRGTLFL